jgi:hypothetical protein
MDERWRTLLRVRELRVRLALNEFSYLRQAQSLAYAGLEEARHRRAQLEVQAAQVSAASMDQQGKDTFGAAQAQAMLDFAVGTRLRAQAAAAPVRRAQLKYDRAQEATQEARTQYRHQAERRYVVEERWKKQLRAEHIALLEREDAARAEEREGGHIARRLAESEDYGDW